jgi:hypothetical protein
MSKTRKDGLPASGHIIIPNFSVTDGNGGFGEAFPYCCGVMVLGEFQVGPLEDFDDEFDDGDYDNRKVIQTYDFENHRWTEQKNEDYNPHPLMVKTKNMTRTEASEWWSKFIEEYCGTGFAVATLNDRQTSVKNHLLAAGWKELNRWKSKGTGAIISLLGFNVSKYDRNDK